jgi:hypothetical protein
MSNLVLPRVIPASPLLQHDEMVHKNLRTWSKELLQGFRSFESTLDTQEGINDASLHLNLAALLASLLGKADAAEEICHLQVKWLLDKSPLKQANAWDFMLLFQPWINLGRIHSMKGKYPEAISHFDLIERINEEETIDLIYDQIASAKIKAFFADPKHGEDLQQFMRINFIDGLYRILLRTHQFDQALAFIENQGKLASAKYQHVQLESTLIIHEQLGAYDRCIQIINAQRPEQPFVKLVYLFHLALNFHLVGDLENAFKYSLRLSTYLQKAVRKENFPELKKLLHLTGQLCRELDMSKSAYMTHYLGYKLSKELGDQRYEVLFAIGAYESRYLTADRLAEWEEHIFQALSQNQYAYALPPRFMAWSEAAAMDSSHFEEMFAYIQQTFMA